GVEMVLVHLDGNEPIDGGLELRELTQQRGFGLGPRPDHALLDALGISEPDCEHTGRATIRGAISVRQLAVVPFEGLDQVETSSRNLHPVTSLTISASASFLICSAASRSGNPRRLASVCRRARASSRRWRSSAVGTSVSFFDARIDALTSASCRR